MKQKNISNKAVRYFGKSKLNLSQPLLGLSSPFILCQIGDTAMFQSGFMPPGVEKALGL